MKISLRPVLIALLLTAFSTSARAQAWRTDAEARIEQYRTGTFEVTVLDRNGNPVAGAPVRAAMQRHAFGFGTAVTYGMLRNSNVPEYREKVFDLTGDGRTFNRVVFGNAMKWPYWEDNQNKTGIITQIAGLNARGIEVRGHNLVWPQAELLPLDVRQHLTDTDPDYVHDRIRTRIRGAVGYRGLRGIVREWDVLNEPAHLFDVRDFFKGKPGYTTGEEIYAEMFQWATEADPATHLFINDYNIVAWYSPTSAAVQRYRSIIQNLIDADAPLYGIGMQGHFGPDGATTMPNVYAALQDFARFDKKIAITEYDYAYNQAPGECRKANEAAAGTYMRDFLTMIFSHPAVESFLMWGFWDGDHWRCDAAMYRNDWSLKPSGEAFLDLVFNQWWTDETVATDATGKATIRGFLGDYVLTAETPDSTITIDAKLETNGTAPVTLSSRVTATEVPDEYAFTVSDNYPEPFASETTLDFTLAAPADVVFEVYDLLGRRVEDRALGLVGAGSYSVQFDGSDLPTGLYIYRLRAGAESRTGQMLLAR